LAERVRYMSPGKKRVAKKATTLEKSTVDADEDDWNKSPIRTLTWGRDAPVAVLFSYQGFLTVVVIKLPLTLTKLNNMKTV